MGSLGFGTFGIVRVWVPIFFFFFFENLVWVPIRVWVRCHSCFSMICSSLFFFVISVFVFVILKGESINLNFLCLSLC